MMSWDRQGRFREAEPLAMTIMNFKKDTLGPLHWETLWAKRRVVKMWWEMGRLKESESLAVQVVEEQKAGLGENDPRTLTTSIILGKIFLKNPINCRELSLSSHKHSK